MGRKQPTATLAHAYSGTEPRNVFVVLTENGPADCRRGAAQYLDTPRA
ncbi:hypothetical protein [Streptomyces coeruleorubidus]